MKRLFCLGLAFVLIAPEKSLGDGIFMAPKFVWDKRKDINEPTQKAILVYDARQEDMILQVKYQGPVDEFGWLIPVPSLPKVQEGSMKCFHELSQYTQRHFETRWQYSTPQSKGTHGLDEAVDEEPPVKIVEIKTVGSRNTVMRSCHCLGQ
jgi:hypothetical protein